MKEIKPLPAKKVIKALEMLGFKKIRQKGSHIFLKHPDGMTTIVPMHAHEDIGKGLIKKIINDAKINRDEWIQLIQSLIFL